jgi:hypothetical protein
MVLANPANAHADRTRRIHAFVSPLNELARSSPSLVMSRYSTSATNAGSTQVAFGALICFVSFDFWLTTVSSCSRIPLETVRTTLRQLRYSQNPPRPDGATTAVYFDYPTNW